MAFLAPEEDEKTQGSAQATTPVSNETILSAPSAMSSTTPGGSATPTATAEKGTKSGAFTNLASYVNANQGNDAAMGQAVTGQVQGKANEATGQLEDWQKAAKAQINAGTANANPTLVSGLQTNAAGVNRNDFIAAIKGYQGPTDATGVSGYGDVKNATQKVQDYADQAGSDDIAARGSVLKDVYGQGGKQYTSGENRLDSYILGAGQGGQTALKNIAANFGKFGGNFDTAAGKVSTDIKDAKTTSGDTRKAVIDAATGTYGQIGDQITTAKDKIKQQQTTIDNDYNGLVAALKSPDLTDRINAYVKLGLNPYEGEAWTNDPEGLMRGDLTSFVQKGNVQGLGDLISAPTQANYSALASLLGKSPTEDFSNGGTGSSYTVDKDAIGRVSRDVAAELQRRNGAATPTPVQAVTKKPSEGVPLSGSDVNNRNPLIAMLPQTTKEMLPTSVADATAPANRSVLATKDSNATTVQVPNLSTLVAPPPTSVNAVKKRLKI
jgi:hypothetical protein